MFETVTPRISGYTAQAEPTAAAIAKRFSAMAPLGPEPMQRHVRTRWKRKCELNEEPRVLTRCGSRVRQNAVMHNAKFQSAVW